MELSRRTAMQHGGKALAVAAVLPTAALAGPVSSTSAATTKDPFVHLATAWDHITAELATIHKALDAAYDTLPEWARNPKPPCSLIGVVRGTYTIDQIETIRRTEPRVKGTSSEKLFNDICDRLIAERRDWEARIDRAEDQSGVTQLESQSDEAYERFDVIREQIMDAPAKTPLGLVTKLRVYERLAGDDIPDVGTALIKGVREGAEYMLAGRAA